MIRFEIKQISSTKLSDLLDEAPVGFVLASEAFPVIMDEDVNMLVGTKHNDTDVCEYISLDDGCRGEVRGDTLVIPLDLTVKAEPQ